MRHSLKLLSYALFAIAIAFITGCSSVLVNNHNIAINNQSNDGYVAVSATSSYFSEMILYFKSENNSDIDQGIPCRGLTSSTTQLLLKLPAGKYAFYQIVSGLRILYITKDFAPLEFEVVKGKVVYLGRLDVSLLLQHLTKGTINLKVSDELQIDLPWFLQNFKNIPQSAYLVKPLYVNPSQDITYPTDAYIRPSPILPPIKFD